MMHNSVSLRRSGFTLVELAIVIVIIALLIGGVLVARDLVTAASIKHFTSSIERYDAGAGTFRLKYKGLPGDLMASYADTYGLTSRSGAVAHGDGNGLLDGCAQNTPALGCETALFWRDMWDGGVSSVGVDTATDIPVDGTLSGFKLDAYLPPTSFRPGTYTFITQFRGQNRYYISKIDSVASDGTLTTSAGLTPQEAHSIDDKMDDGAPDNGTVRAMSNLSTFDAGGAPSLNTCVNTSISPIGYDVLEAYAAGISCQISIRSSI